MVDHTQLTPPSPWVTRFAPLAPDRARVLDLACGSGRHGRVFVEAGHSVDFVDRNVSGLADIASHEKVQILEIDLEDGRDWPFKAASYDVIVVTNYLYRPHLAKLAESLRDGGLLIYETFALGNEKFGKPSNPDFLLKPGELLDVFASQLAIIAYEHGQSGERVIQHICARRGELLDYSMI